MSAMLILPLADFAWPKLFRAAGSQHQAGAGRGRGADEFAAGERLIYHFLRSANWLCLAEHQRQRDERDMDAQPGNAVVLLDQNQPDGQRDVNQALHEQRQPRAEAEQQHHAGDDERRAEQMVERVSANCGSSGSFANLSLSDAGMPE